ncbi:hypothetical protein PanWU01x14_127980 [Parasponia andersonii]|uniref:Retrovirus-related Pol polyprotein from transposon TNT 1-94-like beta-barrel domain-containing protein n=1 Tax=Parasponia andersonii TaxID=3476 RepID=A0A2P5CSN6_PARAD|nr:hypothetical protein PanWU01x14_127980 [Parasponia andersonii]
MFTLPLEPLQMIFLGILTVVQLTYHHKSKFSNTESDFKGKEKLLVGNGKSVNISRVGRALIPSNASHESLLLDRNLYVPKMTKNLLSASQLNRDNDVCVEFYFDF